MSVRIYIGVLKAHVVLLLKIMSNAFRKRMFLFMHEKCSIKNIRCWAKKTNEI